MSPKRCEWPTTAPLELVARRRYSWRSLLLLSAVATAIGCAHSRPATVNVPPPPIATPAPPVVPPESVGVPPPVPPSVEGALGAIGAYVESGIASWYGAPFHGQRASSGEIYDMNKAVAAHRTLPFGSIVRVTNLNNGQHTEVRIIDRGPFVGGRVIDLSVAAAKQIGMMSSGTAPVRIELISSPRPLIGDFAVQVGAFQKRENADRLRDQWSDRYPVSVQGYTAASGRLFRVRVGRFRTQQEAQRLVGQFELEGLTRTFVVRLDDAP